MALRTSKDTPSGPGQDPDKVDPPKIVVDPAAVPIPAVPTLPKETSQKPEVKKTESIDKKKKEKEKTSSVAQFRQFMMEVIAEYRKITWPPFNQVVTETGSVLFLVAVITLMVLGFDWLLSNWVFGPLEHFARLHGGGVGS